MNEFTSTFGGTAAGALPDGRAKFIRKTYTLLAAAILAFVAAEFAIFATGYADEIAVTMLGGPFSWLIVLGAFMGVSFLANWWANSQTSSAMQYLGLGLYIVAEAIIFVPMIFIAATYSDASVIPKAGIVTLGLFLGITATVFITRTDFSFLGPILAIGGFAAMGFIVASLIFCFSMGRVLVFVMVAFEWTVSLYSTLARKWTVL